MIEKRIDKVSEILAEINEQNQKTADKIQELANIAKELREQADELIKQSETIEKAIKTMPNVGGIAIQGLKENRQKPRPEWRPPILDHTYSECHDTAVGGCFYHSDSC